MKVTDKKHGFAAMDPEKQRQIASKGGKAVHEKGTGHEFTPDEARVAGKAGGIATSKDREHMRTIGRKGGEAISSDRVYMAQLGRKGGAKVGANREHMAEIGRRGAAKRASAEEEIAIIALEELRTRSG